MSSDLIDVVVSTRANQGNGIAVLNLSEFLMKHQNNFHVIKHSKLLIKGFAQKLGFGHFVNAGTFRQKQRQYEDICKF